MSSLLQLVLATPETDAVGESIVDAALEEFLAYGLRRTNVDVVARRAGVSRATLYRRFRDKDALVQAVLVRECRRFFGSVADAVATRSTVEERLVEGFVVGMRYARADRLLNRLLASDPEALLPYLTTNGALVVAAAREFLVWQGGSTAPVRDRTPDGIAELFVRLAISFTLMPESAIPLGSDDEVRAFACAYLAPLMRP
ncbi:TetR/AcrR family transcriptional regulator [Actinophytocola oryzae]|uniref:TetR family transcriptional regulator n=1 Tax=Actinophytocola oryzae TaxID=502181 RepID=A0A4V3FQ80_9PSEU|nr:TetR/AcrR family transcriptional regulator [Actinophytocola oryzae]TDV36097.1 TetR family transcriptional regulator [Actinophytocola oryzae]